MWESFLEFVAEILLPGDVPVFRGAQIVQSSLIWLLIGLFVGLLTICLTGKFWLSVDRPQDVFRVRRVFWAGFIALLVVQVIGGIQAVLSALGRFEIGTLGLEVILFLFGMFFLWLLTKLLHRLLPNRIRYVAGRRFQESS